jgi:hypothetical protein
LLQHLIGNHPNCVPNGPPPFQPHHLSHQPIAQLAPCTSKLQISKKERVGEPDSRRRLIGTATPLTQSRQKVAHTTLQWRAQWCGKSLRHLIPPSRSEAARSFCCAQAISPFCLFTAPIQLLFLTPACFFSLSPFHEHTQANSHTLLPFDFPVLRTHH